jgi:hypothetical protein
LLGDPLDRRPQCQRQVGGSPVVGEVEREHREHRHVMTDAGTAAEPRSMVPPGLIIVLSDPYCSYSIRFVRD